MIIDMLQKILAIAGHVFVVLLVGIGIGIGAFILVTALFGDSSNTALGQAISDQEVAGEGAGTGSGAAVSETPGTGTQPSGTPSQEQGTGAATNRPVVSEAFTGDSILLFGMEWEEAWAILGDGSDAPPGRLISNSEIGVEVTFASAATATGEGEGDGEGEGNAVADTQVIRQIRLRTGSTRVNFNGIRVGDTLKSADQKLMGAGAEYFLGLRWIIDINGATYEIRCLTTDDTTISSIQVRDIDRAEELGHLEDGEPSDEDPHDFEPQYWA